MSVARFYDETKNPEGRFFGGVPLADIDEDTWNGYSDQLKASVDADPMYRKTRPHKPAADAPDKTKEGD